MRTLVSTVLALAAVVLTAAALPAAWLERNVVSRDGFVQLAGPLGSDPQLQQELAGAVADQAASLQGVPDFLAPVVRPLVAEVAGGVTRLPGYPEAWSETLRRTHELNLTGDGALAPASKGQVAEGQAAEQAPGEPGALQQPVLDATPLVELAGQELASRLQVPAPAPGPVLIPADVSGQERAVESLRQVLQAAAFWKWPAGGAVVAAVLSLLSARRRSSALAGLGLGLALVAGGYWLAGQGAAGLVPQAAAGSGVAQAFLGALATRAADSFGQWLAAALAVAAVLIVLGLGSRLAVRRR